MLTRKARGRDKSQEFDPREPPEIPGVTGLALIGGGGSASVYKGQEPAMRRFVAVKILHTQLRQRDEQQAFRLECEHAGEVGEHPYAADVYRNGFADDWPFLVMRYYARGSLAGALRFAGQQPVGETLTICANVATALQYAHNLGILHRDVKPENILCDGYGDPVLTDFGISTDRDAATRTLRHAMTPAYAAPEVLQHGGGWPHSDVWSLAATLYALLCGRPPFYDPRYGDPQANLRALAGPLPPLGRPDVPEHVVQTLTRALVGRPDTRTASARRFAEELNADLESLGLSPVPIRVDGDAPPGSSFRPAAPAAPAAPVSAARSDGFTTTTAPRGSVPQHASAAPPPPAPGTHWPQAYDTTNGLTNGERTGYLDTNRAYRRPEPPAEQPRPRRKLPRAAIAGGGALVLVVLVVAYLLAPARHPPVGKDSVPPATVASATSPPADVTAVVVSATSVRLSWKNTGSHVGDAHVVVSMGNGYAPRFVPNQSPQVITGLSPLEPYCFAVGYVVGAGSDNVAYSKVTARACVRGGTPAAG